MTTSRPPDDAATSDVERVRRYGAGVGDDYGGVYVDGDLTVALFTAGLPAHEAALRQRMAAPGRLRVRVATRSLAAVEAANERLPDVLAAAGLDAVRTVGMTVHDGEFVVEVGLAPYDQPTADRVRDLAAPDPVVVREVAPPRLFRDRPS